MIGSRRLLRRIDTDFVNISPVAAYTGASIPSTSTAVQVQVTKGSAAVSGTWVPLNVAQSYLQSCLAPASKLSSTERATLQGLLHIFLSDVLFERFPTALQDFHRSSTPGRLLQQFGPHFQSTMVPSIAEHQQGWDALHHPHHHLYEAITLGPSLSWAPRGSRTFDPADQSVEDTQLSPSEQEIFQAICANPDWEQDAPAVEMEPAHVLEREEAIPEPKFVTELVAQPQLITVDQGIEEVPQPAALVPLLPKTPLAPRGTSENFNQPLRRSKRVADALSSKTQTRSRRRSTKALS